MVLNMSHIHLVYVQFPFILYWVLKSGKLILLMTPDSLSSFYLDRVLFFIGLITEYFVLVIWSPVLFSVRGH